MAEQVEDSDPGGVFLPDGRSLQVWVTSYPEGFTQGTVVLHGRRRDSGAKGIVVFEEVRWKGCARAEKDFLWCVRDLVTRVLKK